MAPEQARGKNVDKRADIWAFGVLLFEMLSARGAFEGETITDTLAKILEREPDWQQLPPGTPKPLRKLIQRCLIKNPKDRLQAIGDARTMLEEILENPPAEAELSEATYPRWKKLAPWLAAPAFLALGLLLRPSAPAPDRVTAQFVQPLPANHVLAHNYRHGLDISSDGRRIAFVATVPNSGGPPRIFVRSLDQPEAQPINGTEQALNVVFSPDGQSLGFQQGQQLKKVSLSGGAPVVLAENLAIPNGPNWGPPGISWGSNGTIVFPRLLGSALSVIPDTGGEPKDFTKLDAAANEASHRLPHFLPDGSAVLFTVLRYTTVTPDWKRAQVWVKSLKTGEQKLLIEDAIDARYVDGSLIFGRQGKLYAVAFDPSSLSVTGSPVQVIDGVTHALQGGAAVTWSGAAQFSVSNDGSLLYAPGSIEPPNISSLVWVDRTGKVTPVEGMKPMFRFGARVSPDGKRIASSELYVNKDIWIFDPARGIEDRATYEGQNAFPIWSPDGSRMAFRSDRASPLQIYLTSANSREAKLLTQGPFDVPSTWSADGKELVFTRGFNVSGGNTDIYAIAVDEPNKEPRPVVATMADERFPEISPDGKWLAYVSNETGRAELYVQSYPESGRRVTITSEGAQEAAWSRNSPELFYRIGNRMMSVRFKVNGADFVPEKPVMLFQQGSLGGGTTVRATFDVAPDGRFLLNQTVPEQGDERARKISPSYLRFVINWTQDTRRLLSTPR
jgi:serine/threonine-protein kinase